MEPSAFERDLGAEMMGLLSATASGLPKGIPRTPTPGDDIWEVDAEPPFCDLSTAGRITSMSACKASTL